MRHLATFFAALMLCGNIRAQGWAAVLAGSVVSNVTISSITADSTEKQLTLHWSGNTPAAPSWTSLTLSNGVVATYSSGNGTANVVFTLSRPIASNEWAFTATYGGDTGLTAFSGTSVTNNSALAAILREHFEDATTGYDSSNANSWTTSGSTIDPKDTGTVIEGSQSMHMTLSAATTYARATITSSSELTIYLKFRPHSSTSTPAFLFTRYSSGALAQLQTTSGKLRINAGTNHDTAGTMSADTTYFIRAYIKASTGANDGVTDACFSTDGTYPTGVDTRHTSGVDGTQTTAATILQIGTTTSSTEEYRVDQIIVFSGNH